jgi:hypothetical protein
MSRKVPAKIMLSPFARLLWRSADVVQLELGGQAVLIEGVDPALIRQLAPHARADGPPPPDWPDGWGDAASRHSLRTLAEAGYLWPNDEDDGLLAPPRPRLAPELGSLAARRGPLAAEVLHARRHCAVAVHGGGRAAAHVATLLAAAGVGRVRVLDADPVRLHQAVPGGVLPSDEGAALSSAAADAVRRAAPDADTTPLSTGERPDLVVLAIDEPIEAEQRDALHAHGWAHLAVRLGPDFGVVGPLVIPGLTSCLRCADLHRRDRDPAWSALAVQLTVRPRRGAASDVAVATVVAGFAALQILSYLDGEQPAAIDGTLELHQPDWRIRRRSWPAHPDCDCSAQ